VAVLVDPVRGAKELGKGQLRRSQALNLFLGVACSSSGKANARTGMESLPGNFKLSSAMIEGPTLVSLTKPRGHLCCEEQQLEA
jgi:hypothetical protein